jgi:hypothetical protein
MDAQTDDTTLIQDTIRTYLDSMYKGSTDKVRECFHAHGTLSGYMPGSDEVSEMNQADFIAVVDEHDAGEKSGPRNEELLSIDITGRVAGVKVRVRYLDIDFTDYLLLIKDGGRWQILNKVWHADPV